MGELFAGRYELIDPIGRGAVGAVWRAWDHRRRSYVAAKVLQQSDAHALIRFVREQALRIDHPHVLAPRSWAADDDQVLFTMELVRGGSLAHLVGDYGPLAPRFVCVLLDQLLSGLAAVHEEDVVHRDIKPANILLEATGTGRPHVRLSDFGVAMRKGEPRLTDANHVVGTPGYFAPEQMAGEEPDFTADLYAVGLVALYLLSGRKPNSRALLERFSAHGGGVPPCPQGVPEALWEVVATLLNPVPQARFRTATGTRKALARACELLPEPDIDDEPIEVFDQLGPLPEGFGPRGPVRAPAPALPPATRAATATTATPAPPASPPTPPVSAAPPAPPAPFVPPVPPVPPPASARQPLPLPAPLPSPRPPAAPPALPHAETESRSLVPAADPLSRPPAGPPAPAPREPVRGRSRRRRPKPHTKVIVSMYLAAAVLLAIGVWAALTTP